MTMNAEYEITVLGTDPVTRELIPQLATLFSRIAWVAPRFPLDVAPSWNVDRWLGDPAFESQNRIAVQNRGDVNYLDTEQTIIAVGCQQRQTGLTSTPSPRILLPGDLKNHRRFDSLAIIGLGETGASVWESVRERCRQLLLIDTYQGIITTREFMQHRTASHTLYTNNGVAGCEDLGRVIRLYLENGHVLDVDFAVSCQGRVGRTATLQLADAGLMADDAGKIWCNEDCETWTDSIYAIGDVVGFSGQPDVSSPVDRCLQAIWSKSFQQQKEFALA